MTERKYGEDEVREIFSLATTGDPRDRSLPTESGGLTLAEIQRIGEQAGIARALVVEAAARIDARGTQARVRRTLGMPIGVARVVALPRAPTDREWEQLVSAFRTTIGAHGRATTSGGLRDWSHGTLRISVEPTEHGDQLRLSELKEDGQVLNLVGALMGGLAVLSSSVNAASGSPQKALALLGVFGGISLMIFAINAWRLPRWARERERQMETIAEHTVKLLTDG